MFAKLKFYLQERRKYQKLAQFLSVFFGIFYIEIKLSILLRNLNIFIAQIDISIQLENKALTNESWNYFPMQTQKKKNWIELQIYKPFEVGSSV
jgi:hypothetical protein